MRYCVHIISPLQVYGKNCCRSRVSNTKTSSPIWPEIELHRDFTTVLVTSKFEENPITNEGATVSTTVFPLWGRFKLVLRGSI